MCGDVTYEALNAFVLLAVLATLSSMSFPCKAILAGFAIGAACSIKQTAALVPDKYEPQWRSIRFDAAQVTPISRSYFRKSVQKRLHEWRRRATAQFGGGADLLDP